MANGLSNSETAQTGGDGGRHMVTLYRSLSTMLEAGLPLFSIFEFFSRQDESPPLAAACGRIAQRLVSGQTLPHAAASEPQFFSPTAVRMMEAGYRGGTLAPILRRLAENAEKSWKLRLTVQSQLTYPLGIALLTLAAVLLLPPLVLNDIMQTVVEMTSEPPALTRFLLNFSAFLGSPWTLSILFGGVAGTGFLMRRPAVRKWLSNQEPHIWEVPALGSLWKDIVALRFLSVFAMSYESGMPATQCLLLASSATGSKRAQTAGKQMKQSLVNGATLADSLAYGGILPEITLEAVEAGEQVGKIPDMMNSAAEMLEAEVESRIQAVCRLIEPIVLTMLGTFVGIFAVGCLLPIIKLAETI